MAVMAMFNVGRRGKIEIGRASRNRAFVWVDDCEFPHYAAQIRCGTKKLRAICEAGLQIAGEIDAAAKENPDE